MTIRYLAQELYRWTRKVEELEKARAGLGPETPLAERNRLDMELLQARQQVGHYRSVLAGKKEEVKI